MLDDDDDDERERRKALLYCHRRILSAGFRLVKLRPLGDPATAAEVGRRQGRVGRRTTGVLRWEEDLYVLPMSLSIKIGHSAMPSLPHYPS